MTNRQAIERFMTSLSDKDFEDLIWDNPQNPRVSCFHDRVAGAMCGTCKEIYGRCISTDPEQFYCRYKDGEWMDLDSHVGGYNIEDYLDPDTYAAMEKFYGGN